MRQIDRSIVQALLAVVIVLGTFLLLGFGREGSVPNDALWSLVGLVVGYYFGVVQRRPGDGSES